MGRPDLRVRIGEAAGIAIECKRLALSDGYPRKYVYHGMARFVVGSYASEESMGKMIGYIQADEPASVIAAINKEVDGHVAMGVSHRLHSLPSDGALVERLRSTHDRTPRPAVDLDHYLVDVR